MTEALETYQSRADLKEFEPNGLLLYALELRFGLDDIRSVAATAITDGSRDRKCDLVYIDQETRTAIVAQGYRSSTNKLEAPANKAADLSIAASWLFGNSRPENLNLSLQEAAKELDRAIIADEIDSIELWYCHNLPECKNVRDELDQAAITTLALLRQNYAETDISVIASEVGASTLNEWYKSRTNPILVTSDYQVPTRGWFQEEGDGWEAVCTSVPAAWLHALHEEHGTRLFSANVRGYMPRRRAKENINFGIETTARDSPGRFWAFNNGVTAIVNDLNANHSSGSLSVSGIAIVNGAQTTGSLSRVSIEELADARVMIRFVRAPNQELVRSIIRFNNSQNQIKPSDFRSGDPVQSRLRDQFNAIPDSTYLGARRGGPDDRARKPSNLVPSDTAAQALAAFHQDPTTAYHDLNGIWNNDEVYARYFSTNTTARHIVFCYSLWGAIANKKAELVSKGNGGLTEDQNEELEYLRRRGSLHLLVAGIGSAAEVYLSRPIANRFSLSFGSAVSPAAASAIWTPLVDALLPFAPLQLAQVLDEGGLRRRESTREGLKSFRSIVASTKRANESVFSEFAAHTEAPI